MQLRRRKRQRQRKRRGQGEGPGGLGAELLGQGHRRRAHRPTGDLHPCCSTCRRLPARSPTICSTCRLGRIQQHLQARPSSCRALTETLSRFELSLLLLSWRRSTALYYIFLLDLGARGHRWVKTEVESSVSEMNKEKTFLALNLCYF